MCSGEIFGVISFEYWRMLKTILYLLATIRRLSLKLSIDLTSSDLLIISRMLEFSLSSMIAINIFFGLIKIVWRYPVHIRAYCFHQTNTIDNRMTGKFENFFRHAVKIGHMLIYCI